MYFRSSLKILFVFISWYTVSCALGTHGKQHPCHCQLGPVARTTPLAGFKRNNARGRVAARQRRRWPEQGRSSACVVGLDRRARLRATIERRRSHFSVTGGDESNNGARWRGTEPRRATEIQTMARLRAAIERGKGSGRSANSPRTFLDGRRGTGRSAVAGINEEARTVRLR